MAVITIKDKDKDKETLGTTTKAMQTYDDDGAFYVNMDYVLSIRALLRVLACVFFIAAMECMVQYEAHWTGYPAQVIFFNVMVCVPWIQVFIFFDLMVCTLDKKYPNYDWIRCVVFTKVLAVVFFMASVGLMADEARRHQELGWKDIVSTKIQFHFDHLVAAVVLAFIAALVFIIDIIVHPVIFYRERKRHKQHRDEHPMTAESQA